MHLLFLPTEIKLFPTTESTFEYYANPFEYSKTVCLQTYPYLSRKIGANALAYPFTYPKRMTDQGRYAKNSAFRVCLMKADSF